MNEIINKNDGTIIKWTKTPDNNYFCLLYNDNKNNYSFTPTTNLNCKLFMIGGGGAGGYYFGGGGGAGAAYYNENFLFKQGITYNFSIGMGGKSDITDFKSLFTQGLLLNIYNNVNIDFNKISFTLDDYSSLNINNTGLIQNFIVNDYDTTISINNSIWNNNTFYIWSGYIIPTTNDEYIKISITTHINTAIWIDNYIYTNENALILNTNNNYLNDVKIIKVDPKRYYNIKIIAYCNNNSINNNFNILFSNNCALYNFNKENEQYSYIKSTDTTLNYNDPSLDNPITTLICSGGGNGGCGFANYNNNLDGGCGGGSGINKKNGKSIVDNKVYLGTDGAIGTFCGGGGGISSTGKDNQGGDGRVLDWFDNKLIFGCGGNGGNLKDIRNKGYGCGGNGGDCCYYSKDIINNNGKNGCVIIFINAINNTMSKTIEGFSNNNNSYDYVSDFESRLNISKVYIGSCRTITNVISNYGSKTFYGFYNGGGSSTSFYDKTKPANDISYTYAGYVKETIENAGTPFSYPQFTQSSGSGATAVAANGTKGSIVTTTYPIIDGIDIFFKYFKYNPIYIYDLLCFHKFLIGLYKVLHKQITSDPYNKTIYEGLTITFTDSTTSSSTSFSTTNNTNNINLHNIFNIDYDVFDMSSISDSIISTKYISISDTDINDVRQKLKNHSVILNKFYGSSTTTGNNSSNSLKLSSENFNFNYNDNSDFANKSPPLPYYYIINNNDANNVVKSLSYIKDYLENDFNNIGAASSKIRTKDFIKDIVYTATNNNAINKTTIDTTLIYLRSLSSSSNKTKHETEMQLLYVSVLNDVLEPNNMSSICGKLYFYCHLFNLIIINTNLQYGLYRLLFSTLSTRPYITDNANSRAVYYFSPIGDLASQVSSAGSSRDVSNYTDEITYSKEMITKIYKLFQGFSSRYVNSDIHEIGIINNDLSKNVIEKQLKLNKIIKKYNDELQLYNTTLSIYKAIIVLAILLLIVIIYIFTYDPNTLNQNTKISIFIILALILMAISIYFILNNNIIYESFSSSQSYIYSYGTDYTNDVIAYTGSAGSYAAAIVGADYSTKGNIANNFNIYDNYQGYITNYVYLLNLISDFEDSSSQPRAAPQYLSRTIDFTEYNSRCNTLYEYLRLYIASTYNFINNSKATINDTKDIILYKDKRQKFYDNRYEFYYNSIEALKNNKYIYYYLAILYALCVILLLFSLIAILIFGNSTENIIITSIIAFLIVLIIIYYIYFKLHQRTRLKVNKNYWAYNNPSKKTFEDSENTNTKTNKI